MIPEGILRQDPNTMPEIKELWAFVAVDPQDNNEGVCAMMVGDAWVPLIASDHIRLDELRPVAQRLADKGGITIRLVKFAGREGARHHHPQDLKKSRRAMPPGGTTTPKAAAPTKEKRRPPYIAIP